MLSINLIPREYFERQVLRKVKVIIGSLFAAVVLGMLAWMIFTKIAINRTNEELARVEVIASQVEQLEAQAKQLRDEVAPIKTKIDFIESVMKYNTSMIPLLNELAKYTYSKVKYDSVTPQGGDSITGLEIKGWAPSITDAGRYLLNLYRASHLFSSVTFSGVPGYESGAGAGQTAGTAQGQQVGFNFTANVTLKNPINPPQYTGNIASAGQTDGVGGAPPTAPSFTPSPPPPTNTPSSEPPPPGSGPPAAAP